MSYHIYTTSGIVLKRKPFSESDTMLFILTADLGLISGSARATRVSKSKLKGFLQEYSLLTVSCVKGKNGWKITNATGEENLFFELPEYSRRVLAQVSNVLFKTVVGEEPHKELFEIVRSGFKFLKEVPKEELSDFETLIVLRILHELGYVVLNQETEKYLKDKSWSPNKLLEVKIDKIKLVGLINKAFKESQL